MDFADLKGIDKVSDVIGKRKLEELVNAYGFITSIDIANLGDIIKDYAGVYGYNPERVYVMSASKEDIGQADRHIVVAEDFAAMKDMLDAQGIKYEERPLKAIGIMEARLQKGVKEDFDPSVVKSAEQLSDIKDEEEILRSINRNSVGVRMNREVIEELLRTGESSYQYDIRDVYILLDDSVSGDKYIVVSKSISEIKDLLRESGIDFTPYPIDMSITEGTISAKKRKIPTFSRSKRFIKDR